MLRAALTVLAVTSVAAAGDLEPSLAAEMAEVGPGGHVDALVYLTHQADAQAMSRQMVEDRVPRRDRNSVIVTALQDAAAFGQADLLQWLEAQPETAVSDVVPFWITSVVAVRATPAVLTTLADREDVSLVAPDYQIELIEPTRVLPDEGDASSSRAPEQGLVAIGAPDVWAMGYTGQGIVVSNMDTGVHGSHEALASRWRGLNSLYDGHPEWAFYDPYTGNHDFPFDSGSHGTHTMGTVCGGAPGDEIGVAPGAEWIAAAPIDRASISQTVSDAILSFQWFANPDGNPLTSFDVPHTNSNSWGLVTAHGYPECDQTFWSFIDNCEAAGVIVLFSAGNEGSSGLRRPGDRALDDFRNMAVAATDPYNGNSIASFSSRGPTFCTSDGSSAIKPDIAAPGVSTRSSVPGGYSSYDGTSMASPHVNGVMALMLSANPDLSGEQVKQIIYDTATDMGSSGKDNNFGYGLIDAVACVEAALETVSLTVDYPDGRPTWVDPNGGTQIEIALGGNVAPLAGSGVLHWSAGGMSGEEEMADIPGGMVGTFPAFDCGAAVNWYIAVESVEGDLVVSPYNAPADAWYAEAWSGIDIAFDDDFNTDQGWSVYAGAGTGNWERVTPSGSGGARCDAATDADGSGMCFVSGNGVDEDVDDGSTTLTSPDMDASNGGTLSYARWYSNGNSCGGADPMNDVFVVDVSDDGGASWVNLETVGPTGGEVDGGWFTKEWDVEAIPGVTPSDVFRIRFTVSDLNDGSIVEAAVDAVGISTKYCDELPCPGDFTGDGMVDVDDVLEAIAGFGTDYTVDDILLVLATFGTSC
ncbi:MAG: S8 family serine peptidase [Phycisphaerales bacterium]|jgi:hypothetical protein|nr:S8 family serine peptidase [Phycisphaerales bacterium]